MESAVVTLDPGRAEVTYDPSIVTVQSLLDAIASKTNFSAQLLEDKPAGPKPGTDAPGGENSCSFWRFWCRE